jgi:hypothetical protein
MRYRLSDDRQYPFILYGFFAGITELNSRLLSFMNKHRFPIRNSIHITGYYSAKMPLNKKNRFIPVPFNVKNLLLTIRFIFS